MGTKASERGTKDLTNEKNVAVDSPKKTEAKSAEKAEKAKSHNEKTAQRGKLKTGVRKGLIETREPEKAMPMTNGLTDPDFAAYLQETKKEVRKMEKGNFDKIIAFDSGDPWYKIAYNSMLIYQYHIMPHLRTPYFKPREDNDRYEFSKVGVLGIFDIVVFAEQVYKMGGRVPDSLMPYIDGTKGKDERPTTEERERIYIFEVDGLSIAKVEQYLKAKMKTMEDLNKLVLPNYLPQELYPDIHSLAEEATKMVVNTLSDALKRACGERILDLVFDSLRDINASCNGYGNGVESYKKTLMMIIYRCAEIQERIRVLLDIGAIRLGACQNLLALSIRVQKDAITELQRMNKADSATVKAIKEAKNFPKIKNVDLSELFTDPELAGSHEIITRKAIKPWEKEEENGGKGKEEA